MAVFRITFANGTSEEYTKGDDWQSWGCEMSNDDLDLYRDLTDKELDILGGYIHRATIANRPKSSCGLGSPLFQELEIIRNGITDTEYDRGSVYAGT